MPHSNILHLIEVSLQLRYNTEELHKAMLDVMYRDKVTVKNTSVQLAEWDSHSYIILYHTVRVYIKFK